MHGLEKSICRINNTLYSNKKMLLHWDKRRTIGGQVVFIMLALPMVSWGWTPCNPDSPNPITINTYGSCSNSEGLEKRVSQLEQTVVKQQGLIMDLIEARELDSLIIRDCSDVFAQGNRSDGVHTLRPTNSQSFPAYCQFDNEGLWTVIQRRVDGSVDFQRSWIDYKNGFGVMDSNFWLGNDNIHALTNQRQMKLRIEITDWEGEMRHADYKLFRIGSEDDLYQLYLDGYSGTAGDSLEIHKNMKFTTFDQDNDTAGTKNCAVDHGGGWWFKSCDSSNLNGFYTNNPTTTGYDSGLEWTAYKSNYSFKETVMKIKPAFPN